MSDGWFQLGQALGKKLFPGLHQEEIEEERYRSDLAKFRRAKLALEMQGLTQDPEDPIKRINPIIEGTTLSPGTEEAAYSPPGKVARESGKTDMTWGTLNQLGGFEEAVPSMTEKDRAMLGMKTDQPKRFSPQYWLLANDKGNIQERRKGTGIPPGWKPYVKPPAKQDSIPEYNNENDTNAEPSAKTVYRFKLPNGKIVKIPSAKLAEFRKQNPSAKELPD